MGREISLFADYHQQENSLTNYCGLLMKMLYEDSPRKFEELLATLLKTDTNIIVGPTFTQQSKKEDSIPDLAITQNHFQCFLKQKHRIGFMKTKSIDILRDLTRLMATKSFFCYQTLRMIILKNNLKKILKMQKRRKSFSNQ